MSDIRKIALIGTASSGVSAPYNDPKSEIWGVSARASYVTRATRWFELHRLEGEPPDWANKWRETMRTFTHDVELLMFYPEPDLGPNVVPYPMDRIIARFGTYFMTSSFAWMMALAIDELRPLRADPIEGEISIYGVDMEAGSEYDFQRPGFRHFMDLARVLEIPLTRLADSGLSYEPIPYPMWQDDPLLAKLARRQKETIGHRTDFENQLEHTRTMLAANAGALTEIERFKQKGYEPEKAKMVLDKERVALFKQSADLSKKITLLDGANEEQDWLQQYLTP